MNFKKAVFLLNLCFPLLGFSYYEFMDYQDDIQQHKKECCQWIDSHGLHDAYARILLTMSCCDADDIPKSLHAGKIFEENHISFQLMHNGIKVIKDGYCGPWMTDLIYCLKGHHEPQEEKVFYEVLKHIPANACMIELGSFWGYYSLWFAKEAPNSKNYLIEPDPERLDLGRKNFALNGYPAFFFRGYIGSCGTDAGNFQGAREILIDAFLEENHIEHVHILHSDIQGSEYAMLESAEVSIQTKKIDYFFISTHSQKIHLDCIAFLESHEYSILAEHSPAESFSVDGLIVAKRNDLIGCEKILISKNL